MQGIALRSPFPLGEGPNFYLLPPRAERLFVTVLSCWVVSGS